MAGVDLGNGVKAFTEEAWRTPRHQARHGSMQSRRGTDVYEFIGHYTGESADARLRHPDPFQWLRNIFEYHVHGRRYSDIAYNSACVSDRGGPFDGYLIDARGNDWVGGHTVARPPDGVSHNRRGHGIVVLHMQPGDQITTKCQHALRKAYGLVSIDAGWRKLQAFTHNDVAPTPCAGPSVNAFFDNGLLVPSPSPGLVVPAGATVVGGEDAVAYPGKVVKKGSRGNVVKLWQTRLRDLGFSPGKIDGIFGNKTHAATVNFQRAGNLTPDGIVGPLTWAKAF